MSFSARPTSEDTQYFWAGTLAMDLFLNPKVRKAAKQSQRKTFSMQSSKPATGLVTETSGL